MMNVGSRTPVRTLAAGLLVLMLLAPFLWLLLSSFRPQNLLFHVPASLSLRGVTTANYQYALANEQLWTWLRNSAHISFWVVLLVVVLASMAGYGFARAQFRGSRPLLFLLLSAQMLPIMLLVISLFHLSIRLDIYDTHLVLIVVSVGTQLPFSVWLMRSAFLSISPEIDAAALIDGCSRVGAFFRIALPLVRPGLGAVAIFSFVTSWNEYLLAAVFLSSDDRYTFPIGLASYMGQFGIDYGGITAASILSTVPVLLAFGLFQRQFVRGLTGGALRG